MIYIEEKYLNLVKEILSKYSESIKNVYAFGSRTRKNHKKYSDLDLAIEFLKNSDKDLLFLIKDALENSSLPIKIDVINLDEINEEFKKSIEKDFVKITQQ